MGKEKLFFKYSNLSRALYLIHACQLSYTAVECFHGRPHVHKLELICLVDSTCSDVLEYRLEILNSIYYAKLQIRGGTKDNSQIMFLISQQKHML